MNPDTLLSKITQIDKKHAQALERLKVKTVQDLLYYAPVRYSNVSTITTLENAEVNSNITVYGILSKPILTKGWKSNIPMAKAGFKDISGTTLPIIWMNQPYMAKMFTDGDQVKLTGKITQQKNGTK